MNDNYAEAFHKRKIHEIAAQFPGATFLCGRDSNEVQGLQLPDPNGEVKIWLGYKEGRIHVSGVWPCSRLAGEGHVQFTPRDCTPRQDYPSITISADRSAQAIWRDISRRFLPAYRKALQACLEARDRHEQYVNGCVCLASDLAQALGTRPRASWANRDNPLKNLMDLPDSVGGGEVEVSSGTVCFKLRNVPADKARKLAAFLASL